MSLTAIDNQTTFPFEFLHFSCCLLRTMVTEITEDCRHFFLYYKNRFSWPPSFESSDEDPLPKLFISTWKALQTNKTLKPKITVCEVHEDADFSDGDVLIFPEMIKYRGLVESNVESFFEDVLVNCKPWSAGGVPEVLTGSYIYVCAIGDHDVRHDDSVSFFIHNFNMGIRLVRPDNEIYVTACCHVGGHDEYVGNALIYSPGPDGKTVGHWCAFGSPDDILHRLDQHILEKERCAFAGPADFRNRFNQDIAKTEWCAFASPADFCNRFNQDIAKTERNQIRPSVADVKGAEDQKLANGENTNKGKEIITGAVGLLGFVTAAVAVVLILVGWRIVNV